MLRVSGSCCDGTKGRHEDGNLISTVIDADVADPRQQQDDRQPLVNFLWVLIAARGLSSYLVQGRSLSVHSEACSFARGTSKERLKMRTDNGLDGHGHGAM